MSKVAIFLWGTLGALLWIVPSYLLEGWVLVHLWTWFVVETFHSAPTLTLAPAIGIIIVANFLAHPFVLNDTKQKYYWTQVMSYTFFRPLFILLVGSIVHSFM